MKARNQATRTNTFAFAAIAAALLSTSWAMPDVAQAQTAVTAGIRVTAPGYLIIDGRWYIFSGPFFATQLEGFPLGSGQGFDLNGWSNASSCAANPAPPNVPPTFRLREGSTPRASFPLAPSPLGGAEVRLGNCEGINLIGIRSASGRVTCQGEVVNPPFSVATCPIITKLVGAPSDALLSDGFELAP